MKSKFREDIVRLEAKIDLGSQKEMQILQG